MRLLTACLLAALLLIAGVSVAPAAQITPIPTEIVPLPGTATPATPPTLAPTMAPTGTPAPVESFEQAAVTMGGVPIPPTGVGTADQPWRIFQSDGVLAYGGRSRIWIAGSGWTVDTTGDLTLTANSDFNAILRSDPAEPLPPVAVHLPGIALTLSRAAALLRYDAASGAVEIDLISGTLVTPSRTFSRSGEGDSAMRVRLTSGTLEARLIPLADAPFPAELDTLTVQIAPVAARQTVALDLDGDPATGLPVRGATNFGADLWITLERDPALTADAAIMVRGTFEGERLDIRAARVPVTATIENGTLTAQIALADLPVGTVHPTTGAPLDFDPTFERLRWHIESDAGNMIPPQGTIYPALAPLPAIPAAPEAAPTCTSTTTAPANLRARPDLNAAIVGGTRAGDTVPIIGQSLDGEWFQLQQPDGKQSWIAGLLLDDFDCPPLPVGE